VLNLRSLLSLVDHSATRSLALRVRVTATPSVFQSGLGTDGGYRRSRSRRMLHGGAVTPVSAMNAGACAGAPDARGGSNFWSSMPWVYWSGRADRRALSGWLRPALTLRPASAEAPVLGRAARDRLDELRRRYEEPRLL